MKPGDLSEHHLLKPYVVQNRFNELIPYIMNYWLTNSSDYEIVDDIKGSPNDRRTFRDLVDVRNEFHLRFFKSRHVPARTVENGEEITALGPWLFKYTSTICFISRKDNEELFFEIKDIHVAFIGTNQESKAINLPIKVFVESLKVINTPDIMEVFLSELLTCSSDDVLWLLARVKKKIEEMNFPNVNVSVAALIHGFHRIGVASRATTCAKCQDEIAPREMKKILVCSNQQICGNSFCQNCFQKENEPPFEFCCANSPWICQECKLKFIRGADLNPKHKSRRRLWETIQLVDGDPTSEQIKTWESEEPSIPWKDLLETLNHSKFADSVDCLVDELSTYSTGFSGKGVSSLTSIIENLSSKEQQLFKQVLPPALHFMLPKNRKK